MLKRRASLLRFLCILGQAGVLGELGELLTDQSDRHQVIFIEQVGAIFSNVLQFRCLNYQQRKLHALSPLVAPYAHAWLLWYTNSSVVCNSYMQQVSSYRVL